MPHAVVTLCSLTLPPHSIALILHLAISSWMYGNSEVLESDVLNTGQLVGWPQR